MGCNPKWGGLSILSRTCITAATVLVAVAGSVSGAVAEPPTREPNPLPTDPFLFTDTLGENPCSFPVLLAITANKEVVTTFTRRNGVTTTHTTGMLKVQLTNNATGKTINRNISGPIVATINGDGSVTQKTAGPTLWVFDPGVAATLPRLTITYGNTESVLGPGTAFDFISQHGSYEDLCATLAA